MPLPHIIPQHPLTTNPNMKPILPIIIMLMLFKMTMLVYILVKKNIGMVMQPMGNIMCFFPMVENKP